MNRIQYDKFVRMSKPGCLYFCQGSDFIAEVIGYGQSLRKRKDSEYSHVAFNDSNGNISESTIKIKPHFNKVFPFFHLFYMSGVNIRDYSAWRNKSMKKLKIMYLKGLNEEQIKLISGVGYRLREKKIFYPVRELIGTLWINFKYNISKFFIWNKSKLKKYRAYLLSKANPLNAKKGMYCCAYVNHCFETGTSGKFRLLPNGIDESVSMVNDLTNNKFVDGIITII